MAPLKRGGQRWQKVVCIVVFSFLIPPDFAPNVGTADFCPQCGRPIERGFVIRPIQEAEFASLRKKMKGKDDLLRQQGFYFDCSGPHAHMEEYARPGNCPKCGARLARRDRNTTAAVEKIESIAEEHVGEYSLT